MPIYEYRCSHCEHQFEVLQKINDGPVHTCPACSKNTAERLISAAAFQLKGNGWYVTDFKNKGSTAEKTGATTSQDKVSSETKATTASQNDTGKSEKN